MEMWWDSSYDRSTVAEWYNVFRKERQGKKGGAVVLYIRNVYIWCSMK